MGLAVATTKRKKKGQLEALERDVSGSWSNNGGGDLRASSPLPSERTTLEGGWARLRLVGDDMGWW